MQEQAELDLERVRVENQRELALLEEVQKKKVLAEKALVKAAEAKLRVEVLPDNQDAVKSKYRFPSMRKVRAGLAIDLNKDRILWGKKMNARIPIASLTKCLTVLTVLEIIKNNPGLSLTTKVELSSQAKKTESSSFLERYPEKSITVEELLISAMVKSANDSCSLLAEFFGGGDVKVFINKMNEKAQELGMSSTRISNAHGLPFDRAKPELDNHSSVRDLLIVVQKIIKDYPIVFSWTSQRSVSFPKNSPKAIRLGSTNPFLTQKGVNGLKTGFTNNAGWCQILTCKYKESYYVLMVLGCPNKTTRNTSIAELLYWVKKSP